MSMISKSVVRQTSALARIYQTSLPFSTTPRYLTEKAPANDDVNKTQESGGSYDSVPVHLGSLGKVVMVLGGLYSRIGDVPDTIPNRAYQKAKDKFRARCVVFSLFGTGLLAFVAAMRGKSARDEGKRYTDEVYNMHRGTSRLHDRLETTYHRKPSDRYSPPIDEINK